VKSKIVSVLAITAAFALFAAVPTAHAQYDNSNDDVSCQTITKGVLKLKPALNNVAPTVPQVIQVGGTLGACTSTTHPALVFPEGKSKFKGVLTISPTGPGCLGLVGSSTATGDLTFSFSATDGPGGPGLLHKTTVVHVSSGGVVGGLATIGNGAYGQFGLGTANGGTALSITDPPGVTYGFKGGNGGATSEALIFTQQAGGTLATQCGLTPPLGIKAINIGVGEIHLQ
jgi:hypothetical protein